MFCTEVINCYLLRIRKNNSATFLNNFISGPSSIKQQTLSNNQLRKNVRFLFLTFLLCMVSIRSYYHTRLMTFSFFFVARPLFPPKIKFATTLENSRELMTCVDQHKRHNSFSMTSLIAKNTELAIAIEEIQTVNVLGNNGPRNSQYE